MKKPTTTLTIVSIVLLSTLIVLVGCSDMMEKMGSISLTINLDSPEVSVASYTLEGALSDTTINFALDNVTPPRHIISTLKKGTWNLTVTAFDESNNRIGIGTKTVELKDGQVAEATLLVVFSQSAPQPSTFVISAPARHDIAQGTITGTTTNMEYKLASTSEETDYIPCTAPATLLAPGTYKIRYAEAHGLEASEDLTVTVPAYQKIRLTISSPTLTTTKAYDGTSALSGSVKPGTLNNVSNGDEVTVHAQATYDSPAVGDDKAITISYSLSGNDAPNYIKPADQTVTGVIGKKQLTISGTTVGSSKVYDRSTEAQVEDIGDLDGIIGSEQVSVTATATYDDKTAGTGKRITVMYTIGGEHAGNYLAPTANTSFAGEIIRKTLSVSNTVTQFTKEYDGTTNTRINSADTLDGVIDGDVVDLQATATYDDQEVGTGKQGTVSYTLIGADAYNYATPQDSPFNTGVITKRQLMVTGYNLTANKSYDGDTTAAIDFVVFDGKATGEEVTVAATATYDSPAVGNDKTITISYSLSGNDAANYIKPADQTVTGVIGKKQLTISGTTVGSSKIYDRSTEAQVDDTGDLDGIIGSEQVSVTATATYSDRTVGKGKQITVMYTIGGEHAGNYLAPAANTGFIGEITKKTLSVSNTVTQLTKVYDGTRTAQLTSTGTLDGVIDGDVVDLQATATYDDQEVGIGKQGTVSYTLICADAYNYATPQDSPFNTGVITKRQLTATVGNYSKTYGEENPAFTVAVTGFVNGENASTDNDYNAPTASSSANSSTVVGASTITISGGSATNYSFDTSDEGTLIINKASLTATVGNYSKTYGAENPAFTVAVTGFVNGESASTASGYTAPTASSSATPTTGVGTSTITISGGSATNYIFNTSGTGTLTINRAPITDETVSIEGTATYGEVLNVIGIDPDWNPTYQWNRDDTAIDLATNSTYTPTADDVGKQISVTVTAGEGNYQGTTTSPRTVPVTKASGSSISGEFTAYYPSLPATQTIINLTGFTEDLVGLEAQVALDGTSFSDEWADLEIDSRGRAMILMNSAVTTTAKIHIRYKETDTNLSGAVSQLDVTEQALDIGDYYEGGIVAYFFTVSDPGYVATELHGLIAAKADIAQENWSNTLSLVGGTQTGMGTGATNTDMIIDLLGDVESYAARAARNYTDGIHHDWFLPSRDELRVIRTSRDLIGNFQKVRQSYDDYFPYWTSTESTQTNYIPQDYAHVVPFDRDTNDWVNDKDSLAYIRAVRYF